MNPIFSLYDESVGLYECHNCMTCVLGAVPRISARVKQASEEATTNEAPPSFQAPPWSPVAPPTGGVCAARRVAVLSGAGGGQSCGNPG